MDIWRGKGFVLGGKVFPKAISKGKTLSGVLPGSK